jgi:hypothetical protein
MKQQIDTVGEADMFGAAESAIAKWKRVLADTEAAIGEILRLLEELEALGREEEGVLADEDLNESTAAKKLNELRPRKELKLARLESAKRNLGSDGVILSPKQISDLESQAAQLEASIKVLSEREREIFARGEVKVGHRLLDVRKERDEKVAARDTILNRLSEHKDAVTFRPNHAGKEARQQLHALFEQLVRKREVEAERLLDALCVDHKGCGSGLTSHFRSVGEAGRLRLVFPPDPSEARELLEQIKALWSVEPLVPLLRICEQEQMWAAGTVEAAQKQ